MNVIIVSVDVGDDALHLDTAGKEHKSHAFSDKFRLEQELDRNGTLIARSHDFSGELSDGDGLLNDTTMECGLIVDLNCSRVMGNKDLSVELLENLGVLLSGVLAKDKHARLNVVLGHDKLLLVGRLNNQTGKLASKGSLSGASVNMDGHNLDRMELVAVGSVGAYYIFLVEADGSRLDETRQNGRNLGGVLLVGLDESVANVELGLVCEGSCGVVDAVTIQEREKLDEIGYALLLGARCGEYRADDVGLKGLGAELHVDLVLDDQGLSVDVDTLEGVLNLGHDFLHIDVGVVYFVHNHGERDLEGHA